MFFCLILFLWENEEKVSMRQSKNANSHFMIKDFTHRTLYMIHQFYWTVAEKKSTLERKQILILNAIFGAIG